MKLTQTVKVKNALGLHARPATAIAKLLQRSKSEVFFTHQSETINAKSIMSVLMLAANKNAQIEITVDGEDAEETMTKLVEAFNTQFGDMAR